MNKIEKLELKHLCGYLPYGLKFYGNGIIKELCGINTFNFMARAPFYVTELRDGLSYSGDESFVMLGKPLLLPLSALTEPMEDGSVPIKIIKNLPCQYISFRNNVPSIWNGDYWTESISELPLCVIEYLYSIHADIYGLTPAGLAIDKRTINNYE